MLKSLKLSPKEAKQEYNADYKPPSYPYGTCISLDKEALEKLGITELPKVGAGGMLQAKFTVTSVSAYENENNTSQSLSLQITDLDVDFGTTDEAAAKTLYGKKDE